MATYELPPQMYRGFDAGFSALPTTKCRDFNMGLTDAMLIIDDDPLVFKGVISGLEVGDKILFQSETGTFTVTSATVANDKLTITYNTDDSHTNLHAIYDLKDMQHNTELKLTYIHHDEGYRLVSQLEVTLIGVSIDPHHLNYA